MNRIRTFLLTLLTVAIFPLAAHAQEAYTINRFQTDLAIQADSSVTVTETIAVTFSEPRHGIYRDIKATDLNLNILSVTDEKGAPRPYSQESWAYGPRIRIGDANVTVTGAQTYVITYTVKGAMTFFDDHDELYWNATGNEWAVPIEAAETTATFPDSAKNKPIRLKCYTGPEGSTDELCKYQINKTGTQATFDTDGALDPYSGLTVVIGLPPNTVTRPTQLSVTSNVKGASVLLNGKLACKTDCTINPLDPGTYSVAVKKYGYGSPKPRTLTLQSNQAATENFELQVAWWYAFGLWALWILAGLIALEPIITYWKKGRDAKGTGVIVPQYDAPDKMRPAEMGTLYDERADLRDLSATIVDLAVRGYLQIKVLPKALGLVFKEDDYELIRLDKPKPGDPGLSEFEKKYMDSLFGSGTHKKISELKYKFYEKLPDLKKSLYDSLTKSGYFVSSPTNVRAAYFGKAVMVFIFFVILSSYLSNALPPESSIRLMAFALLINAILTAAFAFFMPRKTAKGTEAYEHILGLKMYITIAEKDRLKFQEKENIFYTLLPYAMTLSIADKWSKAFKDTFAQPPDWYVGGTGPFRPMIFVGDLGKFSNHMGTAMTSMPQGHSSGGFHSSGFSGGFSGGGFGGGGGGSW